MKILCPNHLYIIKNKKTRLSTPILSSLIKVYKLTCIMPCYIKRATYLITSLPLLVTLLLKLSWQKQKQVAEDNPKHLTKPKLKTKLSRLTTQTRTQSAYPWVKPGQF